MERRESGVSFVYITSVYKPNITFWLFVRVVAFDMKAGNVVLVGLKLQV